MLSSKKAGWSALARRSLPAHTIGAWATDRRRRGRHKICPARRHSGRRAGQATAEEVEMTRETHLPFTAPHVRPGAAASSRRCSRPTGSRPLGPQVDAFEPEFAAAVGAPYALALSSGTAALHLALLLAGVGAGDEVLVSTLTFSASANPVVYLGGRPTFIDSERTSWNMDPALLAETLDARARRQAAEGRGAGASLRPERGHRPDLETCDRHGVPLIEDAAEALGATYQGRAPGTFGWAGIFSFNGNKIITTSGGGMLVSADMGSSTTRASWPPRPASPRRTTSIGDRLQLPPEQRAGRHRPRAAPGAGGARAAASGRSSRPTASSGRPARHRLHARSAVGSLTRWLTVITIDPAEFGADREESAWPWKPRISRRGRSGNRCTCSRCLPAVKYRRGCG